MEKLQKCRMLDTADEQACDDIVKPASEIGEMPIALSLWLTAKDLFPTAEKPAAE